MTNTPAIAAAATILLHAAMLAAVVNGLVVDANPEPENAPIKVQLLAPSAATPPVAQAVPQPPPPVLPAPPAPKKERPPAKPKSEPRPASPATPVAPRQAQETATEVTPQATAPALPPVSAPVPAPVAPVAPVAPARTGASEASYASTNRIPPYPRISTINGDEGTVILRVLVTAEGTAGAVEVKTSSGHPPLDESARRTVQTWRFRPATVDGKAVAEWYQVPIPFKLQNN